MVFLSLEGLQLGFDDAFFMICKCIFHAKLLEVNGCRLNFLHFAITLLLSLLES
jgi:hypothetical protein